VAINPNVLILVVSALADKATAVEAIEMGANGLPTTFVPGRNIMFLTAAAALAYRRGIRALVGGMCETDYSGYPDCRDETIKATARALALGMDAHFTIHTPLMKLDKASTWALDPFGASGARSSGLLIPDSPGALLIPDSPGAKDR